MNQRGVGVADRTEKLLALILLQVAGRIRFRKKVHLLSLAGFTVVEMSDLLECWSEQVHKELRRG